MKISYTHTGKIYTDFDRQLEFLTVGDYGKENNIKANFLGFTKQIDGVENTDVDLTRKWVATISTQKGCPMQCKFCDVPKYGYHGNANVDDLAYQIETIIKGEGISKTERFNVHYARMGEPTFNPDVIRFTDFFLDDLVYNCGLQAATIHPVVSTMCPAANKGLEHFLQDWCYVKNTLRRGEAGLQLSINSTSLYQRDNHFSGMALPLKDIAKIAERLPSPIGRKYTLNFAVTEQSVVDAKYLTELFSPEMFIVKITPIHKTKSAQEYGFDITTSYEKYDVYKQFEEPLLELGWDVIVFVPSVEEDADRITCGNAIISTGDDRQ